MYIFISLLFLKDSISQLISQIKPVHLIDVIGKPVEKNGRQIK